MPTPPPRALAPGIELRCATASDIDDIVELSIGAHGDTVDAGIRQTMLDPDVGPAAWTVVTVRGRVVSTCTLLPFPLRIGHLDVPGGAVEYVATDPEHRHHGFVREQVEEHHRRSAARGDLVQVIAGIPYFYRLFGYGYGASYPDRFGFSRVPAPPGGHELRPAAPTDRAAMQRLHEQASTAALVALRWSDRDWDLLLSGRRPWGDDVVVATRTDEGVVGWVRFEVDPDLGAEVVQAATLDRPAARALLAHAAEHLPTRQHGTGPHGAGRWWALARPGDPWDEVVRAVGDPAPGFNALYVRVPDPIALLEHLRPLLDQRLRSSALAQARGELVLSRYRDSIRIEYADGRLGAIEPGPVSVDPWEEGHVGIPPEWFPALVLGRFAPSELEARVDDVTLDPHRELVEVLFPTGSHDLVGPT